MRFSASRLKAWMECALKAHYRYDDNLPRRQNAKASFGTVIHHALQVYNDTDNYERAVLEFKTNWDQPELLGVAPDYWPKFTSHVALKKRGLDILADFHERQRFQTRTVVGTEIPFLVPFGDHELHGYIDCLEIKRSGTGTELLRVIDYKALTLDTAVLTPHGWAKFGDLSVGDCVIGGDGAPTAVTAVRPQGIGPVVRVSFSDGTFTRCSPNHLWAVHDYRLGDAVLPVNQFRSLQVRQNRRYFIPTVEPVQFADVGPLSLHPYLLGVLLGDGALTQAVTFTKCESELADRVRELLPRGTRLNCLDSAKGLFSIVGDVGRRGQYPEINPVLSALRGLGLHGLKSTEKFIPDAYLQGSIDDRRALLAGLMDTDGSSSNRNQFRTSSPRLRRDFVELCRSLGGVPRWTASPGYYCTPDGKRHVAHESYHVSPCVPFNPFFLERKAAGWHVPINCQNRTIVAVEPDGEDELQCITVDNQSGQFVVDGYVVTHNSNAREPNRAALALDIQFCADAETEILTARGWLRHDQVQVGDSALTLNQAAGVAEWQPVLSVHAFDAVDQELVSIEGKAHSSLTTMNHRWPVRHIVSNRNGWREEERIVDSASLTGSDRIYCAAPVVGLPQQPKYLDEFVEIVAWVWTEGHVIRGGSVSFAQSQSVNPENVARIRATLQSLFGLESASLRALPEPAWRAAPAADCVRFYLNRAATNELRAAFSDLEEKIVDPIFISGLTRAQLRLFIDVSIMADGYLTNGCQVITQCRPERLDAMQMAYSLLGERSALRERRVGGAGRYAGYPQWILSSKRRRPMFNPRRTLVSAVRYTGLVWCPSTPNQTWMARRHGHVYFTGNTVYDYAAGCKEFWVGVDGNAEFPGLVNGEWLWETTGKQMTRRAIWYQLWNQKELDAGPRTQTDYDRLYRVCEEIRRAIETQVFVPTIGDPCQLCDYVAQCALQIPAAIDAASDPDDTTRWI